MDSRITYSNPNPNPNPINPTNPTNPTNPKDIFLRLTVLVN